MSLRERIERLERRLVTDECCPCEVVLFRLAHEPDPRPPICPRCGRGPGDYPAWQVRTFIIIVHRTTEYGLKELNAPADQQSGV